MTKAQEALAKKKAEPAVLALARKNLLHYSRYMFKEYHEVEFMESWYHELICLALMKVLSGEIDRLLITIPPSYGKTEFAVKLFISFAIGKYPWFRAIYATYSDDLATETPADVKSMITSEAYAKVFGEKKLLKSADKKWYTSKNGKKDGGMYSTTIEGGITGFHGDVLVIDDAMKAILKNNKAARRTTHDFYKGSASTRLRKASPIKAIIGIMQRLHEDDLAGYLIENENFVHINLTGIEPKPQIYEFFEFYYERDANEPLNVHMEDVEALAAQKETMKENWHSQYMQDPRTIETGYVSDEDFVSVATWELSEDNKCIIIDPAQSIKETADNRSISLLGSCLSIEKIELFNIYGTWFGKWSNAIFVNQIIEVMINNPSVPVFIETSGGGIITEQYLKKQIQIVNYRLKSEGKPTITNRVVMFSPKTKISKNQKIDQSITYLKNHQIRFVGGGVGQEQVKKEYKGFHPEKDSKEDDCIDGIASVIINNFITPKSPPKPKTTISMGDPRRRNQNRGKYRI